MEVLCFTVLPGGAQLFTQADSLQVDCDILCQKNHLMFNKLNFMAVPVHIIYLFNLIFSLSSDSSEVPPITVYNIQTYSTCY